MSGVDIAGLVEELRWQAPRLEKALRVEPPLTLDEANLMRRAADALLAQAERGDEYERLYRQAHLDYVTAEYKVEASDRQRDEALAALKASEERGERLSQELASARLRPEPSSGVAHE